MITRRRAPLAPPGRRRGTPLLPARAGTSEADRQSVLTAAARIWTEGHDLDLNAVARLWTWSEEWQSAGTAAPRVQAEAGGTARRKYVG